ncbi:hypothetical protein LWC34_22695 [Kibdelosporangium philippinense]|uniref:Uncharacterized protein n=1 Tax=Kibdelosporangium philippinense TaxID=211113 RepID=A0ABS8ZGH5_9PSEU|nr:hypothetical protein [Kibdelosporangium philippinense]
MFQLVPEPKTSKNKVHLDVRAGDQKRAAGVTRLTALVARISRRGWGGPFEWVTIAAPQGIETRRSEAWCPEWAFCPLLPLYLYLAVRVPDG